jgi:hypothetical protein
VEEAEALLRRGSTIPIEHLIRLIHAVNPTTRSLRAIDATRRYSLKAQLQSQLIRSFPDQIQVVRTGTEGVVSLLHGYVGLDACHAVVDELEEDARAWVTYQLDVTDAAPKPGAYDAPNKEEPELDPQPQPSEAERAVMARLHAGRQAVKRYDFDAAAKDFEAALELDHTSIEAARAILGLWVETLGTDGAALALESRLPKPSLADPEIKALLATAAARSGDTKHAERLTLGLENTRAAEIIAICAKVALKDRDASAAALWLAQLRWLDSMHPAIEECERALHELAPGGTTR